jgi:hypothetical protein
VLPAGPAFADPPQGLPQKANATELAFAPAYD